MNRVAVTGIGVVSPAGNSVEDFWKNLSSARSFIKPITRFDTAQFPTKYAGEITDFEPTDFMDQKKARRVDRFVQFGLAAVKQAVDASKLNLKEVDPYLTSIFFGTATGGQGWVFDQYEIFREKGYKKLNPFTAASTFPNAISSNIAIELGFKGRCDTISSGCASSLSAIGYGFESVRNGSATISVVGGSEALLYAPIFGSYSIARVLSTLNGGSIKTPRPFDRERDGTILAEGAGALVLEEYNHAVQRNAPIYAEIVGFALGVEAYHMIAHEPDGIEMARIILMALKSAEISPSQIDYIHMHGMGDPYVDKIETLAVKRAFGEKAHQLTASSIKSMIGHTQGACGSIESVATILSMKNSMVLPTINLDSQDADCDLNYTPWKPVSKKIKYAMVNTLGFGGKNAALVLKSNE